MIEKRIVYFAQGARVGCDNDCRKAWGIQCRPRVYFDAGGGLVGIGTSTSDMQEIEGGTLPFLKRDEEVDPDNHAYERLPLPRGSAAMKRVPYFLGLCTRCRQVVVGHLLRGRPPCNRLYGAGVPRRGITLVGRRGARHRVLYLHDVCERGGMVPPRDPCRGRQ